jgi:hypothetical protein
MHRGAQPRHRQVGFEGVDLAPEGVAAHVDVDGPEAALVGPAVEDLPAQQDHARAGAEGRHAAGQPLGHRLEQPGGRQQHRHGGRLAARQDQARYVREVSR